MGSASSIFGQRNDQNKFRNIMNDDEISKDNVDTETMSVKSQKNMLAMKVVMQNAALKKEFFHFLTRKRGKKACLLLFKAYEDLRDYISTNQHSVHQGVVQLADIAIPQPEEFTKLTEDFEIRFTIRSSIYQLQKLKKTNRTMVSLQSVYKHLIIAEDVILQDLLQDLEVYIAQSQLYQQMSMSLPPIHCPIESIAEVSTSVSATRHYNSMHRGSAPSSTQSGSAPSSTQSDGKEVVKSTVRQEDEEDEETRSREVMEIDEAMMLQSLSRSINHIITETEPIPNLSVPSTTSVPIATAA